MTTPEELTAGSIEVPPPSDAIDWDAALASISEDTLVELEILHGELPDHLFFVEAKNPGIEHRVTRHTFETFAEHMSKRYPEVYASPADYSEENWRENCAELYRDRETWADRAHQHSPFGQNFTRLRWLAVHMGEPAPDATRWLEMCAESWEEKDRRDAQREAERVERRREEAGYLDFTDPEFWDPPEPRVFVPRMLLEGQVGTIYSPGGVGKSLLSLDICVGLTVRCDLFGEPVEPATVLYLDRENGTRTLAKRLVGMGVSATDQALLSERLHYSLLGSIPPLDTAAGGMWLYEEVVRTGARFVVIDTLSKVVEGEENANPTWQALHNITMAHLKRAGVTILELDHSGKDPTRGQRGAGAKRDNVDVVWRLEMVKKGELLKVVCEKDRDEDFGGEGSTHFLVRETWPLLRHRFATTPEIVSMKAAGDLGEASAGQAKVLAFVDSAKGPVPKSEVLKELGGENSRNREVVQSLIDDAALVEFTQNKRKFLRRTPRTSSDTSG